VSPSTQREAENQAVRIVRYPNRRLYDRTQGRYVTLHEIVAMIHEGKAVTVHDSKTNEDLTGTVLTQILLEFHPERVEVFPVPVLHLMIRANDVVLAFLREYLRQSLAYLDFWQRAASFGSMAGPLEWMRSFLPAQPAAAEPPPVAPAGAEALARRVEELERRLRALDAESGKDEAGAGRRKRGPSGRRTRRAPDSSEDGG
jgi:polyhydroxyalkanoate synthesis repressor PhaR